MKQSPEKRLPAGRATLVYSCSGCSSSAQMANALAVRLDREGIAEMSCIVGIGGGVASLIQKARLAGKIIGIDGCAIGCVRRCLAREDLKADIHYDLQDFGVEKRYHEEFDPGQAEKVYASILADVGVRP